MEFKRRAVVMAQAVQAGLVSQADAECQLGLAPGEHLAPTGVITGSGAHPEVPRFGADQTDSDHVPGEAS